MPLIIPNAGDTSGGKYAALDQAEPDALDFEILSVAGSGVVSGCTVTSNDSATDVSVASGVVLLNGTPYVVTGGSTGLPSAPADNRFDVVVARISAGAATIVVVTGTESATNPAFPKSASVIVGAPSLSTNVNFATDVVLAAIYRTGSGTVTASRIVDKRITRTVSFFNQGASIPSSGVGSIGDVYYQSSGVPIGTASGVYVKDNTGAWIGLAKDVGAHFPIGAVAAWPTAATIPSGCQEFSGQSLAVAAYTALFAIYGYAYGGSGATFILPNWNGKSPRGTTNTSLMTTVGGVCFVGADSLSLATANLPSHTHSLSAHTHTLTHSHGFTTGTESADHAHAVNILSGNHNAGTEFDGTSLHPSLSGYQFVVQAFGGPNAFNINAGTGATITSTATTEPFVRLWNHQHQVTGNTGGINANHTHSGTTSSQDNATTSAPSSDVTGAAGSGTAISTIPASVYTRWIVRASLGTDTTYTGGAPTDAINIFSMAQEVANPTVARRFLWVASTPCTVYRVRGKRTGGTAITVNVKVNNTNYVLNSNLSLTSTTSFVSALANQNVALVDGDVVEVEVVTATGSPTDMIVQVDFTV